MSDRDWRPGNPTYDDIAFEERLKMRKIDEKIKGEIDTPPEVIMAGDFPEYATVPLVVYVGGERKVIGEATVTGNQVKAVLGEDIGEEMLSLVFGRPGESAFSFGFREGPNPYKDPAHRSKPVF